MDTVSLFLALFTKWFCNVMHVTISREAIQFSIVLWRSVLTLPGKHKKTFAYLGSLRGQHKCLVACFNAKGKHYVPPILVAARWVGGRFLAGIAGSNPVGGIGCFVFWDCCVLWVERSLRMADQVSRGVRPNVVSDWVWSQNINDERLSPNRSVKPRRDDICISCLNI